MKNKKKEPIPQQPINAPVVFQQNSVVKEKMQAIANLSLAVHELSKALNSVNTTVRIEGNHIINTGCAIKLDSRD
jgi:hypothetical protein